MNCQSTERGRRPRRALLRAVLVLSSFALSLGACELAVRAYLLVHPARLRLDRELGWCTVEGLHDSWTTIDPDGRRRHVVYSTDARGFRVAGNLASKKPRVLVLGDSFTQAIDVSDGETYAALLGKALGVEVFAYGVGGYGSLQEALVLERSIDVVKPELVVWQFCTNDFVNNDLDLERASRIDNNGMRRPYLLEDGSIVREVPKPFPWLRDRIDSSRLLLVTFVCWDRILARSGPTVEHEIARDGLEHVGFARSARTTERILGRVRARVAPAKLVVFSSDEREPYFSEVRRICAREGIPFVGEVAERVSVAEQSGECVRSGDRAHWNDRGHAICAEALVEALRPMLAAR